MMKSGFSNTLKNGNFTYHRECGIDVGMVWHKPSLDRLQKSMHLYQEIRCYACRCCFIKQSLPVRFRFIIYIVCAYLG